jgi:hypothetical protein
MTSGRASCVESRTDYLIIGIIGLLAVVWAGPALAGEPGFYSGGEFHPLIPSQTEYAVEFDSAADRQAAGARMRSATGTLEEIPWGERNSRFAILRVPEASAATRMRARSVDGIRSMHHVYRVSDQSLPILGSGRIIVRLRSGITDAERAAMFADYKVVPVDTVAGLANTWVVEPTGDVENVVLDTANALYQDGRTVYAHPDFRMPVVLKQIAPTPNGFDTFFDRQWYLYNFGQVTGVTGADIDIFDAWRRASGIGVLVGEFDDCCDVMHEDLVDRYTGVSHDASDNSQGATAANPRDVGDRHGTATMGLIVATSNTIGISGVSPNSQFTVSRGVSSFLTLGQMASAYAFARNQGVDVHNNSWGFEPGTPNPDVIVNALDTAFVEGRNGLGMVLCFASGNGQGQSESAPVAVEVFEGEELATLGTVIGVGASNSLDQAASYSNYGTDIDVLAPSGDFSPTQSLPLVTTTDNTDGEFVDNGYNNNGQDDFGNANLADPQYTDDFGGTSASSPLVSGIAALILSIKPDYTAFMVRNTIEHTCDKIDPEIADYDGITERSLRYGYGRVNAGTALEAVYDGYYWPERVADVTVEGSTIFWKNNDDLRVIGDVTYGVPTIAVLVVESNSPFSWHPTDGNYYSIGQALTDPDTGASVGATVVANIDAELFNFDASTGTQYFGIYSVGLTERRGYTYGFGVSVDSDGNVLDSGKTLDLGGSGGDNGQILLPPGSEDPRVSIEVNPLIGDSPLTVHFKGNAQTSAAIESYLWDFGDGATSSSRETDHTYFVASGSERFFPKLTVTDVEGRTGERSVAVDVTAPTEGGDGNQTAGSVAIQIANPDSPGSDISSGIAPLAVVLTAEISGLTTPADGLNVAWDLGDGNTGDGLSVFHTYQLPGRFPITVSVTTDTTSSAIQATRFLDVFANPSPTPTPTPTPTASPAPSGGGCGAGAGLGTLCLAMVFAALVLVRRR